MPSPTSEDREDLQKFREAWSEFCDTGDETELMDLLSEDFVWMATWDAEPELGKTEMRDHLAQADPDTTYESEQLLIRDDWAIEQVVEQMTREVPETGEPEEIVIGGCEVYKRQDDREWKQILSLPYLPYRSIEDI